MLDNLRRGKDRYERAMQPAAAQTVLGDFNDARYTDFGVTEQVDTCAGCHTRRYPVSADDQPGQPLLDHFMPELLRPGLYHADGQIQDEVFEYGPFVQSKMYRQGVRCQDCHDPHILRLRREGNNLCVACHQPSPHTARFAMLPAKAYDTPAHHFHPTDSAGAQCVSCHMPAKTYMVIDPRRDHNLRLPRPDLSVKLGVPMRVTDAMQTKGGLGRR